ncbi:MAG: tRNA (N6-isopentenyl adenosine(37)-C2)-methylthiotransferase MiaB [Clostridia bacterium]|nr:tRNA (N6-isopentenyl adenosine(37)-C2)-methylthiotransferase MiaB [Clostridia bacterium]
MQKNKTTVIPAAETEKQARFMDSVAALCASFSAENGRPPKAFVRTFGCQMNEHDSEKISGMLSCMGYSFCGSFEEADLAVLNTCCVRENAEEKVFGHLGALKALKRGRPGLVTVVCGCMTEQPQVVEEIKSKYKNVDLVFGTHNLHRFPELLYGVLSAGKRVYEVSRTDNEVAEGVPILRDSRIHAWVTIMYGCDNYCTYCIVPYVRGRERSRRPDDVIAEIRRLDEEGFSEITLLGQNVNSYGKDLEGTPDFASLLQRICDETKIKRVRFMTSHPKDLSPRLIDVMAANPAICRQLHLPVQSGSTSLLKKMNRKYTREDYLRTIKLVKERIPGIALSTDIIVGFPGETEEDFEDTLSLIEEVRFDQAFTFIYSPRAGTPAATYGDRVPDNVIKDRFERLLTVQNRISREINDAFLGRTVRVLCEGLSKTDLSRFTGRTEGNKIVNFTSRGDPCGRFVNVEITGIQTWSLEGREAAGPVTDPEKETPVND